MRIVIKKNKKKNNHKDIVVPAKELPILPHKRDWRHSFHWRVLRIMAEFVDGFQFLGDFKKSYVKIILAAVFGLTLAWALVRFSRGLWLS